MNQRTRSPFLSSQAPPPLLRLSVQLVIEAHERALRQHSLDSPTWPHATTSFRSRQSCWSRSRSESSSGDSCPLVASMGREWWYTPLGLDVHVVAGGIRPASADRVAAHAAWVPRRCFPKPSGTAVTEGVVTVQPT